MKELFLKLLNAFSPSGENRLTHENGAAPAAPEVAGDVAKAEPAVPASPEAAVDEIEEKGDQVKAAAESIDIKNLLGQPANLRKLRNHIVKTNQQAANRYMAAARQVKAEKFGLKPLDKWPGKSLSKFREDYFTKIAQEKPKLFQAYLEGANLVPKPPKSPEQQDAEDNISDLFDRHEELTKLYGGPKMSPERRRELDTMATKLGKIRSKLQKAGNKDEYIAIAREANGMTHQTDTMIAAAQSPEAGTAVAEAGEEGFDFGKMSPEELAALEPLDLSDLEGETAVASTGEPSIGDIPLAPLPPIEGPETAVAEAAGGRRGGATGRHVPYEEAVAMAQAKEGETEAAAPAVVAEAEPAEEPKTGIRQVSVERPEPTDIPTVIEEGKGTGLMEQAAVGEPAPVEAVAPEPEAAVVEPVVEEAAGAEVPVPTTAVAEASEAADASADVQEIMGKLPKSADLTVTEPRGKDTYFQMNTLELKLKKNVAAKLGAELGLTMQAVLDDVPFGVNKRENTKEGTVTVTLDMDSGGVNDGIIKRFVLNKLRTQSEAERPAEPTEEAAAERFDEGERKLKGNLSPDLDNMSGQEAIQNISEQSGMSQEELTNPDNKSQLIAMLRGAGVENADAVVDRIQTLPGTEQAPVAAEEPEPTPAPAPTLSEQVDAVEGGKYTLSDDVLDNYPEDQREAIQSDYTLSKFIRAGLDAQLKDYTSKYGDRGEAFTSFKGEIDTAITKLDNHTQAIEEGRVKFELVRTDLTHGADFEAMAQELVDGQIGVASEGLTSTDENADELFGKMEGGGPQGGGIPDKLF